MAIELAGAISAAAAIREWFSTLRQQRADRQEGESEALDALYRALNETRLYLASRVPHSRAHQERGHEIGRDRDREEELSRLWTRASLKLRDIDHDLAERCLLKSDYWAEGASWPRERVVEARIELDRVFKEAREMF